MVLESVPSRNENFQDLERHDLLTGEPRYVEDEIRNTRFGMIFGILAAIFAIVAMILMWFLYGRDKNRTYLWHALWLIAAIILAILTVIWSIGAGRAVRQGRQPTAFLTYIVFLGSLVLVGYLLVESIWLILWRPVHFDYLVARSTVESFDFTQRWRSDRKKIWWTVFFSLATAIMFALIAYIARSVVWNRYQMTRMALYLALTIAILAAWLIIYWVEESYEFVRSVPYNFGRNLFAIIKGFAIVALVLAGVNAIVNLLQFKVGYFVLGALEIVTIILVLSTAGLILRGTRDASINDFVDRGNCAATMAQIHENEFNNRLCANTGGGKYLPVGQSCRKEDIVVRFEGGNQTELRSLNPSCCARAKFYFLYPFMLVGFWGLILCYCLAVAVGCNFYLADTNEYLASANRTINIIDFIGLALVFIMLIAWAIYFIARKANRIQYAPNSAIGSYINPQANQINNLDLVPQGVLLANAVDLTAPANINDGSISYTSAGLPLPVFSTTAGTAPGQAVCTNTTACVDRVAILFRDSTARILNTGGATAATTANRLTFFPTCTGQLNDYIFYYGTTAQINTLLRNLRISPRVNGASSANVLIYHDQVNRSELLANGQVPADANTTLVPTPADPATCGTGFTTGTPSSTTCVGICRLAFLAQRQIFIYNMKGRFFYLNNGVRQYDIHNQVSAAAFDGLTQISTGYTLYQDGLFVLAGIPRTNDTSYVATVRVTDPTLVYLPKSVDVLVERDIGADEDLSAGRIRLLTRNGVRCAVGDTACITAQPRLNGNLIATVRDGSGETPTTGSPPLEGTDLSLYNQHTLTSGALVRTIRTGLNGQSTFTSLPYDAYTVVANRTNFLPGFEYVDLQSSSQAVQSIVLRPINAPYDMRVTADINEPNVDFDLLLEIVSDKGYTCTVSPYNKYCGYAAHTSDLRFGSGEETILVKRLAVANYLAYLQPSPSYAANCPAGSALAANSGLYHVQSWNYQTFLANNPTVTLSTLDIDTETVGSQVIANNTFFPLPDKENPVETDAQASTPKLVLQRNGVVPATPQYETTFFRRGTIEPLPQITGINGTVISNSTTSSIINGCNVSNNVVVYTDDTTDFARRITNTTSTSSCNAGSPNITVFQVVNSTGYGNNTSTFNTTGYCNTTVFPNGTRVQNCSNNGSVVNTTNSQQTGFASSQFITVTNPANSGINNTIFRSDTFYNNYTNGTTLNRSLVENATIDSTTGIGNGTRVEVYNLSGPAGAQNVSNLTACNATILSNGSTVFACNTTNATTFANGTTTTSNSTFNRTTSTNSTFGTESGNTTTQLNNTDRIESNFTRITNQPATGDSFVFSNSNTTLNGSTNGTVNTTTNTSTNATANTTETTTVGQTNSTNAGNTTFNNTELIQYPNGSYSLGNTETQVLTNLSNGTNYTLSNDSVVQFSPANGTTLGFALFNQSTNVTSTSDNNVSSNFTERIQTNNISYTNNDIDNDTEISTARQFANGTTITNNLRSIIYTYPDRSDANYTGLRIDYTFVTRPNGNTNTNVSRVLIDTKEDFPNGTNTTGYTNRELFSTGIDEATANNRTERNLSIATFNSSTLNITFTNISNISTVTGANSTAVTNTSNATNTLQANGTYTLNVFSTVNTVTNTTTGSTVNTTRNEKIRYYTAANGTQVRLYYATISTATTTGGVTTTLNTTEGNDFTRRRMLLERAAHFQGNTVGNFIFISCFTGYGQASIVNVNSITVNKPTIDQCRAFVQAQRPNYTVQNLRAAVDDYNRRNPVG